MTQKLESVSRKLFSSFTLPNRMLRNMLRTGRGVGHPAFHSTEQDKTIAKKKKKKDYSNAPSHPQGTVSRHRVPGPSWTSAATRIKQPEARQSQRFLSCWGEQQTGTASITTVFDTYITFLAWLHESMASPFLYIQSHHLKMSQPWCCAGGVQLCVHRCPQIL